MSVRAATPVDAPALDEVVRLAFGDGRADDAEAERVAGLVVALRASGHVRAELLTESAGQVIGHVLLSRSWVDARDRLVEVLVLSPLSVLPDHQRQGVGTALVAAAISEAGRLGAPALFLEGSPSWYAARGFRPAGSMGFGRPSARVPEPAFQVALLAADDGARGPLVYCDPFWSLDCVGLRDPLLAELGG